MKKTLMLAATVLTLGVGSALAADGDVNALPAQVSSAPVSAQASQARLFPAANHAQTSVYGLFRGPGYAQGGLN